MDVPRFCSITLSTVRNSFVPLQLKIGFLLWCFDSTRLEQNNLKCELTSIGRRLLLAACLGMSLGFSQVWTIDFEQAKLAAAKRQVPILLVFEGSDWCAPCRKLNKTIFNTDEFTRFAQDHLILVKADFPREKKHKLDPEQQEKNNHLAERYNPEGYFPLVLVLDSQGKVLGKSGYAEVTPAEYIQRLNAFIPMPSAERIFKRTFPLMGCRFEITVVAQDSTRARQAIDLAVAEIKRIENLISSWDPASQTSKINKNAGIHPVKVDRELLALIQRAQGISKLTDGAFDISYAALDTLWKFDGSITILPSEAAIRETLKKVGYQNIILDEAKQTVFLKNKGMKIGFGAIGKGYAADCAKKLLISNGVSAGIINASGDITTWGRQPDRKAWKVAITNPFNMEHAFALLPVKNGAVVTSGDYGKYIIFNGKRYPHILDPRTGYPAFGLRSVTVFAPKAELADALATSIFVMGPETGLDRINQLLGVECIVIDDKGTVHNSKNINIDSTL